jgi:F-type H+-transporting ATPase subunit a
MNLVANREMVLASGNITIGTHHGVVKIAGLTVYLDVVWTTLIAAAIVLLLGFLMVRKVTSGVPGKLQLFWETITEQVADLADSAIGPQGRRFVGLGVTVFFFILICNWLAFIPSGSPGFLAPPTGDVNLPLAMALTVIFLVHYNSIRARGFKGYLKHYATPYAALTPINIIEEITKPITMTFRLFGNIFSGVLMVTVIVTLIPPYLSWIGLAVWKPFDELFIGAIQAFIFALLTIMYLGMGMSTDDHSSA